MHLEIPCQVGLSGSNLEIWQSEPNDHGMVPLVLCILTSRAGIRLCSFRQVHHPPEHLGRWVLPLLKLMEEA